MIRHTHHLVHLHPSHTSHIKTHPSSLSPPASLLSVGVEGGGEDDVPADGQRGLLHLAAQDRVSHDAGGLSHLLQHLVQALDAAHHRALLDVCEQGDLCERLVEGRWRWDGVWCNTGGLCRGGGSGAWGNPEGNLKELEILSGFNFSPSRLSN